MHRLFLRFDFLRVASPLSLAGTGSLRDACKSPTSSHSLSFDRGAANGPATATQVRWTPACPSHAPTAGPWAAAHLASSGQLGAILAWWDDDEFQYRYLRPLGREVDTKHALVTRARPLQLSTAAGAGHERLTRATCTLQDRARR
jgi:hypothetical protein